MQMSLFKRIKDVENLMRLSGMFLGDSCQECTSVKSTFACFDCIRNPDFRDNFKSGNAGDLIRDNSIDRVVIDLTEDQEKFLKLFAKNHYPGAKDNVCTPQPIHVVQSYNPHHIPYGEDTAEFYDDDDLRFCWDQEYGMWFKSDTEAVKGWYDYRNEECPIPIEPFSQVEFEEIMDVCGEEVHISGYDDYFKAYGIEWIAMAWECEEWKDVAYFFILEEAKRYMKYQSHNLNKPRTYTLHGGYANKGEYHHFWELLFDIGKQLNGQIKDAVPEVQDIAGNHA